MAYVDNHIVNGALNPRHPIIAINCPFMGGNYMAVNSIVKAFYFMKLYERVILKIAFRVVNNVPN